MLTRRAAPLPATAPATALGKPVVPIKIVPPPYGDIHGPSFYAALKVGNSSGPRPDSITSGHNHGGVAGVHINVGYDDVRADLSAYLDNQSYALPAPQEPSVISYGLGAGNQIVTNIHGGVDPVTNTGNCLEAGTALYNTFNDPTTHSIFWVGDFCNTGGRAEGIPVQTPITFSFEGAYVRDFGDGIPRMSVELYQPIGGDGSWHAIVYNYGANPGRWDDMYHNYGNLGSAPIYSAVGGYSWSLDETHYFDAGACPQVPTASAQNIYVAAEPGGSDANNTFRLLRSSDYTITNGGDCYHDDGSSFQFAGKFSDSHSGK